MALFPAYAQENEETEGCVQFKEFEVSENSASPSLDLETSLLASDEEEPRSPGDADGHKTVDSTDRAARSTPQAPPPPDCDFYQDRARDTGNLHVSTLYFPGRPNYSWRSGFTLGAAPARGRRRKRRLKRYYEATVAPPAPLHDDVAARAQAYRRLIADEPADVHLWLRYIHFQEWCVGGRAALEAAQEGGARAPSSAALRALRHRLAARHLPRPDYLAALQQQIATEKSPPLRTELWIRLIGALASSPAACSADALAAAARAALNDTKHYAPAYPAILLEYGLFLRAAGLWELLVLLIELVGSMSFPGSAGFPPAADAAREADVERQLLQAEDEIAGSGLPLAARWARLERARAAAHWRPASCPRLMQADPQRAPLSSDVSELLQPCAPAHALQLAATLLQLAKVPLLPGTGALHARTECWEGALPVLRAARRLPPAHPARARARAPAPAPGAPAPAPAPPAAAAAALLADPPHYFTAHSGYQAWVDALWDACCGWVGGTRRVALVCWRLRWLHTLLLLQPQGSAEGRRIRQSARATLRSFGGAASLPFVQFARIEALVNGPDAGVKAAWVSVRAALRDAACPHVARLHAARVLHELELEARAHARAHASMWPLVCAVLGRPLPDRVDTPPSPILLVDALERCEKECQKLEEEFSSCNRVDTEQWWWWESCALEAALLPGAGEWAAARVLLAPAPRRAHIYARARAAPPPPDSSVAALRYWEQQACALTSAAHAHGAGARTARALAAHAPHNAYLAIASGGAPLWAGRDSGVEADAESEARAWGALLPALLPALSGAGEAGEAAWGAAWGAAWTRRAAAAARRLAAAGGAPAAACVQAPALELCARLAAGATTAPDHMLYRALDDYPHHKWLYVRGACWSAEGAALADLLLDRQLRLHALPLELHDAPHA